MSSTVQTADRSRKMHLVWLPVIALSLISLGCSGSSTTGPDTGTGTLSLNMVFSQPALAPSPGLGTEGLPPPSGIVVTRVRFLLREIKFKSDVGDSVDFKTTPSVVELDLAGNLTVVSVSAVPVGTYDEIRFKVHRLDPQDPVDQDFLALPDFTDFNIPFRPSMIVEGTVDVGAGPEPFVFQSDDNEEQRRTLLGPLQVTRGSSVNVTLSIDRSAWFYDGAGGVLDPRDVANEQQISDNIELSIDAFKDNNHDGLSDD